jgi:carbamoyltransferase
MNFLGINSFFEHPAVALVCDGRLVFAAEDERFTGIKHGRMYTPFKTYLPFAAMYEALAHAGLTTGDLHEVSYSYSSWLHLRSLSGCLSGQRLSTLREEVDAFRSVRNTIHALRSGYELPEKYKRVLRPDDFQRIAYREWDHHLSHAASTFFCSGFDRALVVVADGSGEADSTSVYVGQGGKLRRIDRFPIPQSLGLFYSFVTRHLGFEPFSDEFKVMGLAAYGDPTFQRQLGQVLRQNGDGRYNVDRQHLTHLEELLGPRRHPGDALEQLHMDIARSAQLLLEEAIEALVAHHVRVTGLKHLCLAGGTFLNCVANGRLAAKGIVDDIFVQPASHDGGTAIGAAALSSISHGGEPQLRYESMALGTAANVKDVEVILRRGRIPFRRMPDEVMIEHLAEILARGGVGALFRGRMEFGPRALGMRSIVASPLHSQMRTYLNELKEREQFRPLSPIVTEEAFSTYFEGFQNRYMLFTVNVQQSARKRIPAVTHVDGTARAQLIRKSEDPFLHALLSAFARRTDVPVLINTSFNVRGKPIVESPAEAVGHFFTAGFDFLMIDDVLIENAAPARMTVSSVES